VLDVTLCVDALEPRPGGIGRYTWELCNGLARREDISLRYYARGQIIRDPSKLLAETSRLWGLERRLVRAIGSPGARSALHSTIVHGPNYFLPGPARYGVVTVHDLSVLHFPELHPAKRVADFERNLERSIRQSCQLITDCETIRRELVDFSGVPADRVSAVPLGISTEFRPVALADKAPVLRQYGLPHSGYGLTLSTLEPRKRIDRLLSAWRELPGETRDRYPLVIAGAAGWKNTSLHSQIERAAVEGWVIPLGFVAETDLPAIYSGATLFAYPSIYEGFGLPPLEAMACGVPTIVAEGSCLVEIAKGAAMVAEPDDIAGFTEDLLRALEDDQWRNEAISAGIQVAKGYTWDKCVDQTVAIYQRVSLN